MFIYTLLEWKNVGVIICEFRKCKNRKITYPLKIMCPYIKNMSKIHQVNYESAAPWLQQSEKYVSHPRVTKFRGWHPLKGDNSKIEVLKLDRYFQTNSLYRGKWPCWVQIRPYFRARPTPSLSFWLFLSQTLKKSQKTSESNCWSNTPLLITSTLSWQFKTNGVAMRTRNLAFPSVPFFRSKVVMIDCGLTVRNLHAKKWW